MSSVNVNLLLLIGVVLAVPRHVNAQELQIPTWKTNDTWTFSSTTRGANWQGSVPTNTAIRFTVLSGEETYYSVRIDETIDRNETRQESRNGRISKSLNIYWRESPQLPWSELKNLQWPLAVGKTWTYEIPRPNDEIALATVHVMRWEDIKVAAGQFHTIVIRVETSQKDGGYYFKETTLWFAPEAKWVIKNQWKTGVGGAYVWEEGVSELQSFSLN